MIRDTFRPFVDICIYAPLDARRWPVDPGAAKGR